MRLVGFASWAKNFVSSLCCCGVPEAHAWTKEAHSDTERDATAVGTKRLGINMCGGGKKLTRKQEEEERKQSRESPDAFWAIKSSKSAVLSSSSSPSLAPQWWSGDGRFASSVSASQEKQSAWRNLNALYAKKRKNVNYLDTSLVNSSWKSQQLQGKK